MKKLIKFDIKDVKHLLRIDRFLYAINTVFGDIKFKVFCTEVQHCELVFLTKIVLQGDIVVESERFYLVYDEQGHLSHYKGDDHQEISNLFAWKQLREYLVKEINFSGFFKQDLISLLEEAKEEEKRLIKEQQYEIKQKELRIAELQERLTKLNMNISKKEVINDYQA